MAPPPSQSCSVPDCDYATPENIPTWEMLTTHLNTHTQAVHPAPAQHAPAPAAGTSKTANVGGNLEIFLGRMEQVQEADWDKGSGIVR